MTRILFVGDSITDCDRRGFSAPLGAGYVSAVASSLEGKAEFLNRGIGGDTVRDLARRWSEDVCDEKPDILFIYIGVNDVWRLMTGFDSDAVPLDEFVATYESLIQRAQSSHIEKVVLLTPFLAEPNENDEFKVALRPFIAAVRSLGESFGFPVIDLQLVFDEAAKEKPHASLAADRVHPSPFGHRLIARQVLAELAALGVE